MLIWGRLTRCFIAVLVVLPLALRAADPPAPTFANVTVHDPSVVRDGATFYVFGSHMASASTTDLMNWTQITTGPLYPNSLIRNQNPQTEFAAALAYAGGVTTFWAPDVIQLGDGKYYFYYCACQGSSPLSALGLAKADAITGPYANVGLLLKSAGATPTVSPYDVNTMPNVVDPSVFFDHTGKLWMVYGSFSGGIFILQLDSTAGSPTIGQPLGGPGYGKKLIGGNSSRMEGAYIIYSPESHYYFLFLTFGGLDAAGGYNIRVGRSLAPDGPFVDAAGNDLTNVKGSFAFDDATIAPYGVKLMGNWQFLHAAGEPLATSRGYVSPGGCSVYRDAATGKYILVFHTRFVGSGEVHEVRVHQMYLNADDWPVVAPHRYAGETIAATDVGRVVGSYKLINHGKDIAATVKTSTLIALNADGTITGTATGTWLLSGDHFAVLVLGGTTYRGVFARQWDDDNQAWVLAFSALSGNGVAVWGSKTVIDSVPAFVAQPDSQLVVAGARTTLTVLASGEPAPTYQWKKNGVTLDGATGSSLTFANVAAGDAGAYTVVATSRAGTVTSTAATLTVVPPSSGDSRLINISTRAQVGTGGDIMIAGFVIGGTGSKRVLLRATGPALAPFLAGTLADPTLELTTLSGTTLATNDNWDSDNAAAIAAGPGTHFAAGSKDAALIITLPTGQYTALVRGAGNTTGIALVELYDLEPTSPARLINLSTRARPGTGDATMIAGFTVTGSGNRNVLIRALGPTLFNMGLPSGFLPDPQLVLTTLAGTILATNDNWGTPNGAAVSGVGAQVGAFPLATGTRDAALFTTLPEGLYTPQVTDRTGATGIALVEVYEAP